MIGSTHISRGTLFLSGLIICGLGLFSDVEAARAKVQKQSPPDFTAGGKRDESHDWNLGPTGARGWIYGWAGNTTEARQILVTAVHKGSPAEHVLKVNDVILGVAGKPFSGDARIQLANAITEAEKDANKGVLKLLRWREGNCDPVELKLQILGTYSATVPYNCSKSTKIFEQGCQIIAKKGLNGISIPNDLNALALLASGKKEYLPMLADYAKKVSVYETESMATWFYGYANIFLSEYIMATGDTSLLEGARRMALVPAKGQSVMGLWGHKFARPDGNLNGYGAMNQPGISLSVSMALARMAGVKDPEVTRALDTSANFLKWFVNKGAIPYGDHQPWPGHEDNGKCSSAAVFFDLMGDADATAFFSKMSTAAYSERERGHTGNFFNLVWAMLGVSRGGPLATGAYMKEQDWFYDLARGWDGSFGYQGSPVGEEEHGKYTSWDSTGAYILAYALPLKSLTITGKRPCVAPALNAKETADVIAAGRDYNHTVSRDGYSGRTTDQLLAGLSSWSPAVRKRSAQGLARAEGDVLPEVLKLLAGSNLEARYGACEALGYLGPKADAAAPQLKALLKDTDPWMQSLACFSIAELGNAARKTCANDMLRMILTPNPADPRHTTHRAACVALFAHFPGSRTPATSILSSGSLEGIDMALLRPALQTVLQNEDSVARGSIATILNKLNERELALLLPEIIKATEKLAPSNEMFADGIRLAGLDLLAKHHIAEGLPLCMTVIEPDRWGSGRRYQPALASLSRYGANARHLVPELQKMLAVMSKPRKGGEVDPNVVALEKAIADILADKNPPKLQTAAEFMAKNK